MYRLFKQVAQGWEFVKEVEELPASWVCPPGYQVEYEYDSGTTIVASVPLEPELES